MTSRTVASLETSFANGGQLSYSYVAPLASPSVIPKIPPWLLRRDSPLRFTPELDPDQWRWIVERTFAWLGRYRRLKSDYERLPETTEAIIHIAMIRLMLRRLAL